MRISDWSSDVCSSDLWGNVDCVIQMGAPKGSSRLLQRIGRANHRLDTPSEAILIPGNRFEYLEARAALDAVEAGERDTDDFRPGSLDVLAQHVMGLACARSEEHTSELQSLMRISYAVFCLKKKNIHYHYTTQ